MSFQNGMFKDASHQPTLICLTIASFARLLGIGDIPSMKILETDESFAFMDIDPLSKGHCLVIPKYHAEFLHQVPDEYLVDVMPLTKKIAIAAGLKEYNVLQAVPHVHFHLIPKPNQTQGLSIHWKPNKMDKKDIETKYQQILENLKVPL
ncbi:hypothetical protein PHYBLDRAFT_141618 [Phycomyces blakesleeanus NRRL 1555(-)]|uniref:HIT domain-containing protein n=1 Tax=Phycomyces blakesleeanus (strain ATCC 8743b / DSM 1359 / FGSC 10004 / NBRC 33097 / NRRL 1555) TaxID=763407 RepID=A0A167PEF0_PHYB8|nr:hypothetical protein PHYBLDRAFT_141618 [Phycomyces blakesleeanus NRRL 1555(-)]OAD77756.1 hypothetical protein PHYBLDRAFT_141618 [Phycomyces blakesleeanus NRRL 1555(-)]|eukprot:XP_018295796.1 hypothetical protein PHYBLDRAFT_141618 [Phycomyces blakesleeanus NRRL 1555(-)]